MIVEWPLGEFLPDLSSFNNPGVVEALNTYPIAGGFSSFNSANGTGHTSSEIVRGSEMFFRNDGTFVIVAGSSTKLITRTSAGVTETSGFTALDQEHVWRFERFKDLVIAVTPNNAPQYLTDVDTATSWVALPGTPPKAAVIGRVGDFLIMGDLTDIDGSVVPHRIRWSAFNNPKGNWVTDLGELSDYRDLDPKYGAITGITENLIFQERAIHRITFVGAPKVFDIRPIALDRGCLAASSLVQIGFNSYFLSQDGFYVTNGASVDPIGANKVDRWFTDLAASTSIKRVHGAVNWPKQSIVWAFIVSDTTVFSSQIIYSFGTGGWSHADENVHYLVKAKTDATTIGDLAAAYQDGLSNIGVIGNPEWLPRELMLSAWIPYGNGSEYATMNGASRKAHITTGEKQLVPGRRVKISGVLPVVENATLDTRIQVLYRDQLAASQNVTSFTYEGANGFCPANVDTRYAAIRMELKYQSDWDKAVGLQVNARPSGGR